MENYDEIRQELEQRRKKALADYMQEFIPLLELERYLLDDLIEAIASYIHRSLKQQGKDDRQLDLVVRKLEEAAQEYRNYQKNAQLPTSSNSD